MLGFDWNPNKSAIFWGNNPAKISGKFWVSEVFGFTSATMWSWTGWCPVQWPSTQVPRASAREGHMWGAEAISCLGIAIIREHHGSHQFFVSSQLLLLFVAQKPRLPILSSSHPCETPRTWTHGAMPSRPCSVREAAKTMVLASLYADAGRNPSLF